MNYLYERLDSLHASVLRLLDRTDYDRRYSLLDYMNLFLFFSAVGWVWEFFYYLVTEGFVVNRGVLNGPWVPIYGVGALLTMLIYRAFKARPLTNFSLIMIMAGVVEYGTSFLLEKLFHKRWWDYSHLRFQLNGRICLRGLFFFAVCGILAIYVVSPLITDLFHRLSQPQRCFIVYGLLFLFVCDVFYSFHHPNTGMGNTYLMYLLPDGFRC